MKVNDIKQETDRHVAKMRELLAQLKTTVLSLPDNPRIKRIAGSPNCFTMSSKDLGSNWSVKHHDFKKQYQMVIDQLENSELSNVYNKLQHIIKEEKLVSSISNNRLKTNYTVQLHPDVVAHLRKMVDMPPTNCPACHGDREWDGDGIKAICHFCKK